MQNQGDSHFKDQIDLLISGHQKHAEQSFRMFKKDILQELDKELTTIEAEMKRQLSKLCRKLQERLSKEYRVESLKKISMNFLLEPYIGKQYLNVKSSIKGLRVKIYEYLTLFSSEVLSKNVARFGEMSLFYPSNQIRHVSSEWYSVTSRCPLEKATVSVQGLRRPATSWLALGVCKKLKQYGPLQTTINKQQFLGNIYLNGSDNFPSQHKVKKDLQSEDLFIIENTNRTIFVYRKNQGRNIDEAFIMDDNVDYYFYIAMKGFLTISFNAL